MKKFFIVLSVFAAFALIVAPSQANMGIPDDVPGCDAIVPFLVGMQAPAINTLAVFTDVRGYGVALPQQKFTAWRFHWTIMTVRSATVDDDYIYGSDYDIVATDAFGILDGLSGSNLTKFEVDIDGDGINDHWAGYLYLDLQIGDGAGGWAANANQMIGQTIVLNLQAGQAAAANTWFREYVKNGVLPMAPGGLEAWSPNALARSEQLQQGLLDGPAQAFGLYPRFYIVDANTSDTCLWIWKSTNWTAPPWTAPTAEAHFLIRDDDEHVKSTTINLPDELNIICLEALELLPKSLFPSGVYPREGWLALEFPDQSGAWWNPPWDAQSLFGDARDWQWAGYTWSFAKGPANESWSYLTQIHRDVRWLDSWDRFGFDAP